MTEQPRPACKICGQEASQLKVYPGAFYRGGIVVGDCPECGTDSPVQFIDQIDATPIPQMTISTGPEAA